MLPIGWLEPIGGLIACLLGYLYKGALDRISELREDHERELRYLADEVKQTKQELMVFTAAMAANREKVSHLEKQSDEIFGALRRIEDAVINGMRDMRDRLDGKQDKTA
jgi:chromosome segregation ATPase